MASNLIKYVFCQTAHLHVLWLDAPSPVAGCKAAFPACYPQQEKLCPFPYASRRWLLHTLLLSGLMCGFGRESRLNNKLNPISWLKSVYSLGLHLQVRYTDTVQIHPNRSLQQYLGTKLPRSPYAAPKAYGAEDGGQKDKQFNNVVICVLVRAFWLFKYIRSLSPQTRTQRGAVSVSFSHLSNCADPAATTPQSPYRPVFIPPSRTPCSFLSDAARSLCHD